LFTHLDVLLVAQILHYLRLYGTLSAQNQQKRYMQIQLMGLAAASVLSDFWSFHVMPDANL
jgi:hypothetical protein